MPYGLSQVDADRKLKLFGPNVISETSRLSVLAIIFRQIKRNYVIYLLTVAVIISILVGHIVTAVTISAVMIMVTFVGFIQEYKAEEAVNSLKKMIIPISIVYRDGKKKEIQSRDIVPEDLLVLGNGEMIPADCVVVESNDLRVNESVLTGEPKEISKHALRQNSNSSEENQIFMGTYIVNGRCIAKVTHTGMNTKFGKIAGLISKAEKELPLQSKVNGIVRYMVIIGLVSALATGLLMFFRIEEISFASITDILIVILALSVSSFPEGFPVVLVTTLAIGAKRMSDKNAIVNRMSIIETLGEASVICSDKTGTLTRGEMTVKFIFLGNHLYDVGGSGFVAHGVIKENNVDIDINSHPGLIKLIEAGILCNDAEIERIGDDNIYRAIGSSTEAALLILGAKIGLFKESFKGNRINEYPFNSNRKMMSVLYEDTVYAKGAPEIILDSCDRKFDGISITKFTEEQKNEIFQMQSEMASKALRTLCVSYKPADSDDPEYQEKDLIFLGLLAMEDPPREGASESITLAKNAGIRVVMVTGDNRETAKAIAKELGLDLSIIDGNQMDQMSDQELSIAVKETTIFARVRPEHKIRLVKAFKDLGEIVAMTGDGVNDAPALKEAHIGIAMGKNGTDVSREASDLILKDDNFSTIVSAIAEGRTVYNNIRKFVTYQLSCNFSEILVLFVGVLLSPYLGWTPPILTSLQILFMNLVTDDLPSITLGMNPTSKDILEDKPRNKENILNRKLIQLLITTGLIMSTATFFSYFIAFNILGYTNQESKTVALLSLIMIEIATAFSYRSFRKLTLNRSPLVNSKLLIASIVSIISTILIIYTPLNTVFETVPLDWTGWAISIGLCILILIINDILKYFNIKNPDYISSTR